MYNRYTPRQDGSYRKDRLPDASPAPPQRVPQPSPQTEVPQPPVYEVPPEPIRLPPRKPRQSTGTDTSPLHFITDLLPRDMDTGDMLVLLILFLLVTDGTEEAADPLLTLALFFLVK